VTRPVVKTETLKKTKIKPAWVLAFPWKVANVVLSPGRKQWDLGGGEAGEWAGLVSPVRWKRV